MNFEEYNEKQLLETAKKYDSSYWNEMVESLSDFMDQCSFMVEEENICEEYLFSGDSSTTYYSYNKNKLLDLVFIELKKEVEKKGLKGKYKENNIKGRRRKK